MTRREVREVAFMILFQMEFRSDVNIEETVAQYYTLDDTSLADDREDEASAVKVSAVDKKYIETIVSGVTEHKTELDDIIASYSKGWTVERLIKVDVSALRYGIFEMKYLSDRTPKEVSINEAVEIAKKYGTEKSKAFVNGVLSSYYKELKGA